jgi:1,4-dihydroxy-2-naphthoate polyprenyltransferase
MTGTSMIQKSTIQLLRFPFSYFLMPVYWFALTQLPNINWQNAAIIFIILHLLIYPSSNGYNSYMDRDTESIGGLKKPLQPTRQLFYATVVMDILAILLGFIISPLFALGCLVYIAGSRMYSYRGLRVKKYALLGYFCVIMFQGGLICWMVYHGSHPDLKMKWPFLAMVTASLLIGGFYPLTQVYQHKQDMEDGVRTISAKLGYKKTFLFCAMIYSVAMLFAGYLFFSSLMFKEFYIMLAFFLPILFYFFWWASKVWHNEKAANFVNTMQMNFLASTCTNLAFITVLILNQF